VGCPGNNKHADRYDERKRMVEEQIKNRGIHDERIIQAMIEVPRHRFVDQGQQAFAYEDGPLPIGHGQTISQPYIVAFMIEALMPASSHRVLEIGTGSGYAAAVLSRVVAEVYSIETVRPLFETAKKRLNELKYTNVHLRSGDGTKGWPEAAPFDSILVSAGAPLVPQSLVDQLAPGGRLVIPVGGRINQSLLRITRAADGELIQEELAMVRFVPLVGEEGWC
jgi:protein-L-isoaspartate(D-aspartate) O-methyltransferase